LGTAAFELDRRGVSDIAVAPLGAVEHLDVVEDIGAGVVARGVDLPADTLALEWLEGTLGHGGVAAPTRGLSLKLEGSTEPGAIQNRQATSEKSR